MSDKDVQNEIVKYIKAHPNTDRGALLGKSQPSIGDGRIRSNLLELLYEGRVEYSEDRKLVLVED